MHNPLDLSTKHENISKKEHWLVQETKINQKDCKIKAFIFIEAQSKKDTDLIIAFVISTCQRMLFRLCNWIRLKAGIGGDD
jgi:hypothetical protein